MGPLLLLATRAAGTVATGLLVVITGNLLAKWLVKSETPKTAATPVEKAFGNFEKKLNDRLEQEAVVRKEERVAAKDEWNQAIATTKDDREQAIADVNALIDTATRLAIDANAGTLAAREAIDETSVLIASSTGQVEAILQKAEELTGEVVEAAAALSKKKSSKKSEDAE